MVYKNATVVNEEIAVMLCIEDERSNVGKPSPSSFWMMADLQERNEAP